MRKKLSLSQLKVNSFTTAETPEVIKGGFPESKTNCSRVLLSQCCVYTFETIIVE